jgi:hypothetical protein
MSNIKVRVHTIQKIYSKMKFSISRSNTMVKVTRSNQLASMGKYCHKEHSSEIMKS